MRFVRTLALVLVLTLLPLSALADPLIRVNPAPAARNGHRVINLIENPSAEWAFQVGAPILEVIFPAVTGGDVVLLRQGDQVMMIDAGTYAWAVKTVVPTLRALGIQHVDIAFNTHAHDDHIDGFNVLLEEGFTFGEFCICQDENYNYNMITTVALMREAGVPIRRMQDEDVISFCGADLHVFLRTGRDFTLNDLSGVIMLEYGNCRYLGTGDIEERGMSALVSQPPSTGLRTDFLKHPHHAYQRMIRDFYEALEAELCVVTGVMSGIWTAVAYMDAKHLPWIRPMPNALRFRTDGEIWVLDYLPL